MTKYEILKNQFGYTTFRPGQEEVIDAVLSGRDVLAVMPTGAGKSLCYQIPALLLPGMTVVISPLISLMKDQVSALLEAGCSAAFLNSSLNAAEYNKTMNDILGGRVKLLYIAPERLARAGMSSLAEACKIPLVVADEAHCISQWGHDFRPSYLQIAEFINSIEKRPVTAAFTATATVKVRADIENILALNNSFYINTGFDRPNLYFEVQRSGASQSLNKKAVLLDCLEKRKGSSGIVYCATRKAVEEIHVLLCGRGFSAARYHAGLEDEERRKNQDDFLYDRKTVMIATNAFGMGIDKSNVSYVIHYNMPKNIESYYQEAGRAGRDGAPADCILLYSGQDVQINKYLITHSEDGETAEPGNPALKKKLEAHNLELLKQMTFYATGSDCLRQRLLDYFGDKAPSYCGNCSNCFSGFTETDVSLEGRKIVSCVYRLKERNRSFGKTIIIDILRGSNNEKIRRFDLNSLSTWGIMKDTSQRRIREILDYLIDEGILKLEDGEFPVVAMGNAGDLLKGKRRLIMELPKEQKIPAVEKKAEFAQPPINLLPETDNALFEKLKKIRRDIAANEAVPAYIVFSDAALLDMSRKKPVSLIQFSGIHGVGRVKLEKYGEAFVTVIREHVKTGSFL